MTASTGKKAVSAALAGTLAVGMVPAAALAAEAPEACDGITALTAGLVAEYNGAKVTQISLNGAAPEATPTGKIEIAKGTTNLNVVPTQVTSNATGNTLSLLDKDGAFDTANWDLLYTNTGTSATQATCPTTIGSYTVQAVGKSGTDYDGITSAAVSFSIIGKSLQGATLYEPNAKNPSDLSDTTFTYTGVAQNIGVALNGEALTGTTDYTVKYFNAAGNTPVASNQPLNAGDYVAVVTGAGDYLGSEVQIKFSVAKLDLSTATVVLNDVEYDASDDSQATTIATINGEAPSPALQAQLAIDYPTVPTATGSFSGVVRAVTAADGTAADGAATVADNVTAAAQNITGSKTASFAVVTEEGIYVTYGSNTVADGKVTALAGALADKTVNLANGESFSTSAITVYPGSTAPTVTDGVISETALKASEYTVTVTDKDGNTVPASSLSTPGVWNVTVAADSAAMEYALGGKATCKVTVISGVVAENDIFVTYDGKAQSSITKTYTGENFLDNVAVKVVVGDKTLVQGTDYKVAVTNAKGEEVTQIVNAGAYKVTVTSDTWQMPGSSANVCDFTVDEVPVATLYVADEVTVNGDTGVAYTGSDITPAFQYQTYEADGTAAVDKKGDPILAALPASAYKVTAISLDGKAVKSIKEAGSYELTIADADAKDNFNVSAASVTVNVIDAKVFQDVPADAWYAQVVDQAYNNGYMGGYAGTKLFGPNDKITRAQVACVLFNMAGGDYNTGNDNGDNSNYGYVSFDDVKPGAYYAKAVAWAKDAGVVNGFAGTNNFGPDQVVTREQFACMLWNYAKAMLSPTVKDVDVAAALASKPDGAKVSGWAREGVAWAVQNKVMGNGGVIDPLATVTRAETAAMAVNFQPEFIKAAVTGITATALTGDLTAGSTYDPQVAVTAKNGASTAFTARSSDEAVATVAADGEITAIAAGTATITYTTVGSTVNGAKLSTSIIVTVA